jgi:GTPase SAR1 family protein
VGGAHPTEINVHVLMTYSVASLNKHPISKDNLLANHVTQHIKSLLTTFLAIYGCIWLFLESFVLFGGNSGSTISRIINTSGIKGYAVLIAVSVLLAIVWQTYFRRKLTPDIRVVVIGMGGTGKTTLIRKHFMHNSAKPAQTEDIYTDSVTVTYNKKNYEISITDYEGQRERLIRDELRRAYEDRESIHAILFVLSFYPVDDESNQLIIPDELQERRREINNHVQQQVQTFNLPILNDIITYSRNLHTVFVLLNQMDILYHRNVSQKTHFAKQSFQQLISTLSDMIEGHNQTGIQFSVLPISAQNNIEIDDENRLVGLRLMERILEKHGRVHG